MGRIEVITGGMFSGKTEELLRRAKRAILAQQKVVILKPSCDTRYSENEVITHSGTGMTCEVININAENISEVVSEKVLDFDVVCFDEMQFYDKFDTRDILTTLNFLADTKRIIIAGLDMDYNRLPYHPMPEIMAIADEVTKLHAICSATGEEALYSHRKNNKKDKFELGGVNEYEPLSRRGLEIRNIEQQAKCFDF